MKAIVTVIIGVITIFSIDAYSTEICRVERDGLSQSQHENGSVGSISGLNIDDSWQNSINCSDVKLQSELRTIYKSTSGPNNDSTVNVIKKLVELGYDVKTETLFVKK